MKRILKSSEKRLRERASADEGGGERARQRSVAQTCCAESLACCLARGRECEAVRNSGKGAAFFAQRTKRTSAEATLEWRRKVWLRLGNAASSDQSSSISRGRRTGRRANKNASDALCRGTPAERRPRRWVLLTSQAAADAAPPARRVAEGKGRRPCAPLFCLALKSILVESE